MKKEINKILNIFLDIIFRLYIISRKSFLLFSLFIFSLILFSNLVIFMQSNNKIFYNIKDISEKKVALVLGTSKYVAGNTGLINLFYRERINTANRLIESEKVDFLILSGSTDGNFYNEPQAMKNDLMKLGIPEDKMFLDYAGLRTLDSVLRAKEVFSQDDIIIVSQKFHLQRALSIAALNNINAIGFAAKDPPFLLVFKTYIREVFSRVNFLFDIISQKKAKFYGEKIEIK